MSGPSFLELLSRQLGTFVSAGAIVLVTAMLIWFGLRPLTRALLPAPTDAESAHGGEGCVAGALEAPDFSAGFGAPMDAFANAEALIKSEEPVDQFLAALTERRDKGPQRQLQRLIDFDEEHAAAILRQWIREGASA